MIVRERDSLFSKNVLPYMLSAKSCEKAIEILLYNAVDVEIACKFYNQILISTVISSMDDKYEKHNIS